MEGKKVFLFVALLSIVDCTVVAQVDVDFDGINAGHGHFVANQIENAHNIFPVEIKGYVAPPVAVVPKTPVEWIPIPGGRFLMGTDDFQNTKPIHEVVINTFEMSKAPVTMAQYAECMSKDRCTAPHYDPTNRCYRMETYSFLDNHPVTCVTWEQAKQYADFMGARLPSEAEWEYAATSGGKNQKYPWGNSGVTDIFGELGYWGSHPHYDDKRQGRSYPVCGLFNDKTLNGLCDMTGNVFQFVEDLYQDSYAGAPADGSAVNSPKDVNGVKRVLRGVSYLADIISDHTKFRSDWRMSVGGDIKNSETGFRIVRIVKPASPIEWTTIPGGKFKMGTSGFIPGFEDTKPVHEVAIKTFAMAKADVTVAQYMDCYSKGKCTAPDTGEGCNWSKPGRQDHPVNCVDWNQANQYAEFAGARLPTESEWEYAARSGGKEYTYAWGNALPTSDLLVMNLKGTMPVCSRPDGNTEQGLCDMSGNVFQWLQDIYEKSYEGAPIDGGAAVTGGPLRVLRGSPFNTVDEGLMRSAYRFSTGPKFRYNFLGFRVAKSL